jgi:putative inorganic carbon (hco3(-)) transporter
MGRLQWSMLRGRRAFISPMRHSEHQGNPALGMIEVLRRPYAFMVWLGATAGAGVVGLWLVSILSGKDGIYIFVAGVDLVLSLVFYPFGILQFIFLSLIGELASEDATQFTPLKILGLVVALRRFIDLTFLGRPLRVIKAPPMLWAFLFVLSLGLSVYASPDIYGTLTALLTYVQLLMIFFLIIDFVRGEREIKYLLLVLVLSGVVNAGFAIYQYNFENVERIGGTLGNANRFGIIQLALLCLSVPFLGSMSARGLVPAMLLALGAIAYSILLSFSRGAFVAAVAVLLYGLLFLWPGRVRPKVVFVAVIIAGLALAPEGFYDRMETLSAALSGKRLHEGSIPTRLLLFRAGIQMGLDHVVTGVGLGRFGDYVPSYANLHTVHASSAHNMYVSIFAEAGSVGLIAFLGFLATSLMAARGWRRSGWSGTRFEMAFVNSVELGYVALLIGGLFATLEYSKVLWILLALAVSIQGMSVGKKNASAV